MGYLPIQNLFSVAKTLKCSYFDNYGALCHCKQNEKVIPLNGTHCYDVNKCSVKNGGCEQKCSLNGSGYRCSCEDGYKLLPDSHSCGDVDECADAEKKGNEICSSSEQCINTVGSYTCFSYGKSQI